MRLWTLIVILSICTPACEKRNPEVCCETEAECAALGSGDPRFCEGEDVCVAFKCVAPGTCDGPEDCLGAQFCNFTSSGGFCALGGMDGATPAFDIAYPNVWRRTVVDQLPFDLMVINTSDAPISMSSLAIKSISDNHPTATVRLVKMPAGTMVPPHKAGGFIVPLAEPILVGSGLVPEVRADTNSSYLEYEIIDAPVGTYDIVTDAIMTLDSSDFFLHFTIHMVEGQTIYADPEAGFRLSVSK